MTKTFLDDALMARMAGGENFNGGLFAGNPPDRLQPRNGASDAHLIGPCPNPDAFPKPAPNPDPFPVQPGPFVGP